MAWMSFFARSDNTYLTIFLSPFFFQFLKEGLFVKVLNIRTGVTFVNRIANGGKPGFIFFHTPQSGSDYLAYVIVPAGINAGLDKILIMRA